MPRRSIGVAIVVLAAVGASILVVAESRRRLFFAGSAERASTGPVVAAVRLNPKGDPGAEVECASFSLVDFTYQVFNRGERPITGLKVGTKCACEAIGDPSEDILPGQSAAISFRLRAPRGGLMQRRIPLLAEGSSEPVAMLDVAMRVKFEPPLLMAPPDDHSVTFVRGSRLGQEFVLDTLEAKADPTWILGLDLVSLGGVEILPPQFEDLPEADPALTRRHYTFRLLNRSLSVGLHTRPAIIRTREGQPPIETSPNFHINVVDSVVIAPNPLVFKYPAGSEPPPRRVKIINRVGSATSAKPVKYDHDLLQVAEVVQKAPTIIDFDVTPVATPTSARETQVQFDLHSGDIGRRAETLTIRFEPSSP